MKVLNMIWPWSEIERLKGVVTALRDAAVIEIEGRPAHREASRVRIAELEARLVEAQKNDTRDATGRFTKPAAND
jgi:hypothetical protein